MTDFKAEAAHAFGMTLLQRLKTLLGLDSGGQQTRNDDFNVTRETPQNREPTTERDDLSTDTESADEPSAPDDVSDDTPADNTASESVDVIDGIGPAYSDRLNSVGINTVADLADADPQAIADETDLSPARIERWIDRATERTAQAE